MQRLILSVLLLGFSCLAMAQPDNGARAAVDKLNNVLIEVMQKAKAFGYQGRVDVLTSVVLETHDFDAISKLAIGKYWKNLSEQEQAELVKKMTEFSIATYAAQFDDYAGEQFKFDNEEAKKNDRVVEHYTLKAFAQNDHKFEYMLHKIDGQWRIINIVVDGVSDLALKRAQYESIMEKEGFNKLLERLSSRISDYAKNRAEPSS